jgi:heme-degrading monooxygenase HmoA
MQAVQEITPFEVPEGKDEEFLKAWSHAAEQVRQAPGVLSVHLHESLDPETKFRFVVVTRWESLQFLEAARSQINQAFVEMRRQVPFAAYPAEYRLLFAAVAASPRSSSPLND